MMSEKRDVCAAKFLAGMIWALSVSGVLAEAAPLTVTSAWSEPVCVDTRAQAVRFAKEDARIAYAARYCEAADAARVVLRAVRYATSDYPITEQIAEFPADQEGSVTFSLPDKERCYRLVLTAYNANGQQVGNELFADVGFAVTGTSGTQAKVDTRENALQLVVDELLAAGGGDVTFAYSSAWITNTVPERVSVSCVREVRKKNGVLAYRESSTPLDVAAPATGDFVYPIIGYKGGVYTFAFADMTASFSIPVITGFRLNFK